MAVEWRNNGEPVDGVYIADVDAEDGSQVQTFKGASYREVADKLLNAQVNATRRINELKTQVKPDVKKPRAAFVPRKLTADEQFQVAGDVRDPSKIEDAIDRVVAARLGAPLEVVRQRLQRQDAEEIEAAAVRETNVFVESTPNWYPTAENKQRLWDYMTQHNLELTAKNFGIAFDQLTSDGLLTRKPEENAAEPEPKPTERIAPQPTTRPRGSIASGIRSSDVGNRFPAMTKPRYTRQEIQSMPRSLYAEKLKGEAGFAAIVDALG